MSGGGQSGVGARGERGPIVLAFSGGLDTSYCVPWLAETYGRPVVTVTVDTGGLDDAAAADLERRARQLGAVDHVRVDAKRAYFDRVLRFLVAGNVRRGGLYPLCVGAERALQAQEVARAAARLFGWSRMGARISSSGASARSATSKRTWSLPAAVQPCATVPLPSRVAARATSCACSARSAPTQSG